MKRYKLILNLLAPIVETIQDGDIAMYGRDPDALIEYLIDELERI